MVRDEVREGGRGPTTQGHGEGLDCILLEWRAMGGFQPESRCPGSHLRKITVTAMWKRTHRDNSESRPTRGQLSRGLRGMKVTWMRVTPHTW